MGRHQGKYARPRKAPPPSDLKLLTLLWAAGAVPELILHISTAQSWQDLFSSGLLLGILFAAVPALLNHVLVILIPAKWFRKVLFHLYAVAMLLLCGSQLIYYKVFGCFYSAFSMANGGEALQFYHTIFSQIFRNLPWLLVMALPEVFLCFWGKRLKAFRPGKRLGALIPAVAAVVLQLILVLSLPLFGKGVLTAYDLYHNNTDPYYSINRLGFSTAFRLDVTRLVTGHQPDGSIVLDTPETTAPETTAQPETVEQTLPQVTVPTVDTSPNVLDISFSQLAESADSDALAEVHRYFQQRTPTNKNEYTGMFEGCNLILITGEAFSYLAVTPERTPTLYKLMTEGISFTNYYVPDWGTSTTDGEYAFLTGTVPKPNVWSFSRSSDNAMPLTMSRQLIARGYNAYGYHGHTYTYYDRDQYLTNLGYDYKGLGNGLKIDKVWPESDLQMVDVSTGDYVGNTPFTTYYMTISGHREFNFTGNMMAYKNRHLVEDEPYSTPVRAYLATQLELEAAMALLLDRLEEAGVLENTVIVLTADHYPNGLTVSELGELLGHEPERNFEIFENRAFIYKAGMEPVTVDTPVSHLDLLPTLSNLFGLEFDSRLYMGRDVFSDAAPLVMFRNRSWITDKASYNSSTGEVVSFTEVPVTDAYVKRISNEVSNRFTVSSRILDYDYWRIVFAE